MKQDVEDKSTQVEPLVLRNHEGSVNSIAFSPDGGKLASGSFDFTIRLWDLNNPKVEPLVLKGHQRAVRSVEVPSIGV